MITEKDLQEAIAECEGQRNPNANTCIKLAAFYTIRNELFGDSAIEQPIRGYSGSVSEYNIEYDSGTEFSNAVKDRGINDLIPLIDEFVSAVQVLNPRLYESFMRKIFEQ